MLFLVYYFLTYAKITNINIKYYWKKNNPHKIHISTKIIYSNIFCYFYIFSYKKSTSNIYYVSVLLNSKTLLYCNLLLNLTTHENYFSISISDIFFNTQNNYHLFYNSSKVVKEFLVFSFINMFIYTIG